MRSIVVVRLFLYFQLSLFSGICGLVVWCISPGVVAAPSAADMNEFHHRLIKDIAAGNPLVATLYVALCDNDSQGIVPVRNRSICNGDDPIRNMYWNGNGIAGYLKGHGWKKVHTIRKPEAPILIEEVWKKTMFSGKMLRQKGAPKRFVAYVVAKAYRGSRIHDAMRDYLTAVNDDNDEPLTLSNQVDIHAGGKSHLVGYIGHDYFMDIFSGQNSYIDLMRQHKKGASTLAKATFALACISNEFIRPAVTRANVYIVAMNNFLTYPSAWTVGGIIDGVAKGGGGKEIYKSAARSFSQGQKCGLKWALKAFSYGPRARAKK